MSDPAPPAETPASTAVPASGPWQPPTAEELQKLLPQYEITALLGRGGMGAVYKGTQIALDRPVAIKILSNTLEEADASFAERFKNEARALGKLSHPGIVGVYDFGEAANGLLYIVMEFIDGTDVAKMISQQKRLHTEHAMAITAHVCDALAYAHERGIIHRDIKPANIMVGYDGVVKVADFGLAKMTKSGESGLTQSGMAMGTLHYMAPEALMLGSAVDQRADIYAVGVMLYQMLTGKLPQGLFEMPSLQVPGLDPRYDGIISKAMREDRDLRYPRVMDLRRDLDAILTQPVVKVEAAAAKAPAALNTQARPQRPAGQPFRPPQREVILPATPPQSQAWMWVAALVLAVLGGAVWLLKGKPQAVQSVVASSPPALPELVGPVKPERIVSGSDAPAKAAKDLPFLNSLGMRFVPVPIPGAPADGKRLLMSVWETRVQDYEVFAKETARDWTKPPFPQTQEHPAVEVSWDDAVAFCEWLTGKERQEGRISVEDVYRLPSDLEWRSATGAADSLTTGAFPVVSAAPAAPRFPWGESWPPAAGAGNYFGEESLQNPFQDRIPIKGYQDGFDRTSPVGAFASNPWGLFDLSGNAMEWSADLSSNKLDPSKLRPILAGGSWASMAPGSLETRFRGAASQDYKKSDLGFRTVLEVKNPDVTPSAPLASAPPKAMNAPVLSPANPSSGTKPVVTETVPSATPTLPSGPTTWTDTKGRRITATFKALASGNVLLDIAGKVTPVPLKTLSAESQKLARAYHDQSSAVAANDPAKATKDKPFTNSLGMKFVPVPGTKVLFCIHETRRKDYAVYAKEVPAADQTWSQPRAYNGFRLPTDDENHPASSICYNDATAFCAWLGKKEGRTYRLPSDREWSFAVGIGDDESPVKEPMALSGAITDKYPWGTYWPPKQGDGNYAEASFMKKMPVTVAFGEMAEYDDGHATTAPVMSFKANSLGIFDLGGNVYEWCQDRIASSDDRNCIMRGSSWFYMDRHRMRSSFRHVTGPTDRSANLGFRCVLELSEE